MVSLQRIHQAYKSYVKIQGIAKAVQTIAISRLHSLAHLINKRHRVLITIKKIFQQIEKDTLKTENSGYTYIIVPFTSDKQCSGLLNSKVVKSTIEFLQRLKKKDIANLYIISMRGLSAFNSLNFSKAIVTFCEELDTEKKINSYTVYVLLLELLNHPYDKAILLYTKYLSIYKQKLAKYTIPEINSFEFFILQNRKQLNILEALANQQSEVTNKISFFLRDFYYYYYMLLFLDAFDETYYSEFGTRAQSMGNAVDNAKEMVLEVNRYYNKAKREKITTELSDVVAAINGM